MAKFSFQNMPKLQVLKEDEILNIHEKALTYLEETGVKFEHPEILAKLKEKGCLTDEKEMILRIPRKLTEQAILNAPEQFLMYGHSKREALRLGENHTYYAPGAASVNFWDGSRRRPGTIADLEEGIRIAESMNGYGINSGSVIPGEIPGNVVDIYIMYKLLCQSDKPFLGLDWEPGTTKRIGKLLEAVFGSREEARKTPVVMMGICPTPPMRWEKSAIDCALSCFEYKIPVFISSSPVMGISCPITIAGSILTHTIETLSFLSFIQLMQPGYPTIYGGIASAMDMRTTNCTSSCVEACLSTAGYSCMAHYYGLPSLAFLAQTDSKKPDYQAGFETAMDAIVSALAGIDVVYGGGTLESYLTVNSEKIAMDGQLFTTCLRLARGIQVDEETLAYSEIEQVQWGADESFLEQEHTAEWYRDEHCLMNDIVDRTTYTPQNENQKDILERARESIQTCKSSELEGEARTRLDAAFQEILSSFGLTETFAAI